MARSEKLRRSQAQERRNAGTIGGVVQPQSGAGKWRKEDSRSDEFLVQSKGTTSKAAKQITIKLVDLDQVELNAALETRYPAMAIEIGTKDYWVVPEWVMQELQDQFRRLADLEAQLADALAQVASLETFLGTPSD